jgi:hypothetical protein
MRTMKNRTTWWEVADFVLRFLYQLREARAELPGLTVRYEELTENPAAVCQGICDFLGVDWEPSMLDYGAADRGPRALGFGDMGPKVASGRIQPGRPLTAAADVPSVFRPICADLGY